ncbi:MAG TPA: AraC family transcriptional regulator [Actinoplanes sp.]|nr:AraC family transcriptional regulator [Actinoplanes sp.]
MSSAALRSETASTFRPPGWAGVATCGLDTTSAQPPRRLSFHVLVLATAGHGTVEVDFLEHPCGPGALLWVRPGQALRVGRNGLIASVVTFDSRLAGDDEPPHVRWQLRGADEDAVINGFAQLSVDCDRLAPGPIAADLLRHQLRVLLLRVALLTAGEPPSPESRTYARFRRLLEAGHPHSRRVEDYAEELGCSVRTLTRACLAATGRTAKQVVDDRVALEARRLLACTPLSVAEVGRHLGFPEPTNFGRFFHREVGTSPGQFRSETADEPSGVIPAQRRSTD